MNSIAVKHCRWLIALAGLLGVCATQAAAETPAAPPSVQREMRGAWIATVANIDWPSKPGLSVADQQAELAALLDTCVELRLNAVVFQVRPACDAMYRSELEPWSEFLTGAQGRAPGDNDQGATYDPLEWAVEQAHLRGLELHAWFNPYRASHPSGGGEFSEGHIARTRPELVKKYGAHHWLDPGEPDAAAHSLAVVLDVVRRYDVDGVHFDDYFYPYPISAEGDDGVSRVVPFPDDPSWAKYCDATPEADRLSRDDWRRDNVNRLIRDVSEGVHRLKPHVRLGVSPFGIWRPGHPEQIQGFDAYAKLYADSKLWLREGWVDYFTPQLYWPIDQKPQSFPVLLEWWAQNNPHQRHLWPGLYTSKTKVGKPPWAPSEIVDQIDVTREQSDEPGHVHFSMKALAQDYAGLKAALLEGPCAEPAIVPAAPWLAGDEAAPGKPVVESCDGAAALSVRLESGPTPRWWAVQTRSGDQWTLRLLPGDLKRIPLESGEAGARADAVAVSAIDRYGRQGEAVAVSLD
ncbi:hypothetical protein Mal64_27970 [Pseudobythopirellula maris]|uniref:Glycosyl hydrolase-like 10 domain-containing protein n=1 Tax=Pseudobythopirellula maris TaxID=2527991 RepID=A0A5C5ZIT2_9BACT|nr:family 10 glycosylhydrolase [Pseudobythopirellula maris]TWT87259.1 hypothetical protein Mal64_27970 [Pseudobythopirellula maris]